MIKMLRRFYYNIFKRYRQLENRCVTYAEGDKLIRQNGGKSERDQWQIAEEEDKNSVIGVVYLERRERILE